MSNPYSKAAKVYLSKRKKAPKKTPDRPVKAPRKRKKPPPIDESKFDLLHKHPRGGLASESNRVFVVNATGKRYFTGITKSIHSAFTPQWTYVNATKGPQSRILRSSYRGQKYVSPGKPVTGAALGTRIDGEMEMVTKFMRVSGLTLSAILEPKKPLPKISVKHLEILCKIRSTIHRRTRVALMALAKEHLIPWAAQVPVWHGRQMGTHIDIVCLTNVQTSTGPQLRFVLIELKSGCGGAKYTQHNGMKAKAPFQDRFQSQQLKHLIQTLCNKMMYQWTYPSNPVHAAYVLRVTDAASHMRRLPPWIRNRGPEMIQALDPVIPSAREKAPKRLTVASLAKFRYEPVPAFT